MKKFPKILAFLILAVFLMVGSAVAVPITLYDILGYEGTQGYYDTGAEFVALVTGGTDNNSSAYLFLEESPYKDDNSFGIYDFTVAGDVVSLGETLEVFSALNSAPASATVVFDTDAGTASYGGFTRNIDTTFGFYLANPYGVTYYSHASLNSDLFDHMMIFDTSDDGAAMLLGSDVVVAIEDGPSGYDQDFDDMVVGVTNVAPATPEPTTMLLFGSGLIGLVALGRKKLFKKA